MHTMLPLEGWASIPLCYPFFDVQCMRNPNEPDWPCLSCIDKNRPEKCRFFKPGLLQSIENFHLQSPRTVNPLPAPRPPEIDLFSASESQSHETYQDTLDFHLPTPPALLVLGQYLNQNQLQSLTNFLHNMFATQPLPVTNLQATVISAGENGPPWCPIVRWKEGTNVEAILAIKLQPTEMVNSFVLYHVTDAITEASSRKSLRVSWSVLKVTEFGELHSAGRRYFEQMVEPAIKGPAIDEDVNETEMLNYAMTLMPVLYRLRQMEKNFQQNGLFWIDRLSPRVVLEDDQGNRCTLLQHVVDL